MAFAYAVTKELPLGPYDPKWLKDGKRYYLVWGTFTNDATDTGGDIVTGMTGIEWLEPYHSGSAVVADSPSVNETFPLDSGSVTIVTTAGADGYWVALGWK